MCVMVWSSMMTALAQKGVQQNLPKEIKWQQYSGEYDALCFQAYHFAKLSLKEALWTQANGRKNAVVVDVDETVLNNSPFQRAEFEKGAAKFDAKAWQEWTASAQADTVAGALDFLKFAAEKHIEVFYITNRDSRDSVATLQNLQRFQFPYADAAHLWVKHESSDKEPRRAELLKNYNILLLCGDNLSDFSNVFYRENHNAKEMVKTLQDEFGTRFIVLPNPMYGDWEKVSIGN